jgi:hypothetical protein
MASVDSRVTDEQELVVWVAKQAIREVLTNYCRAVDRLDRELFDSVFHPDARIRYPGMLEGGRDEFAAWCWSDVGYRATNHQVTNTTIKVQGTSAVSEAYVTARIRSLPDPSGRRVDMVVTGRYLDRWTKRDSGWMIDDRLFLSDVFSEYEVVNQFDGELPGRPGDADYTVSVMGPEDPSYERLAAL